MNLCSKVSIIIPIYNTERYLRKCLDSVCGQTLQDTEIICVNDCSPDNSLSILEEYSRNDNRIKVINFAKNKGVSVARNAGIKAASGEYIGFVDSDDFIDLDFYEKLYNKAVKTNADAVKGKMCIKDQQKNFEKSLFYDINEDIESNFAYFYHSFTTAIYNTIFIKKNNIRFPENILTFEDPYFSIKAGFIYKKVEVVNNTFYHYFDNENSLTKEMNYKHVASAIESIVSLGQMLNDSSVDIAHYTIVYDFLLNCLRPYVWNDTFDVSLNLVAANAITAFWRNCQHKEECMDYHFKRKQISSKKRKDSLIRKLRNNVIGKKLYAQL